MLATVLFTDIVESTAKAIELGDRHWRELLERHNMLVRRELLRFRGREVDTSGDGFFATFDGPARGYPLCRRHPRRVAAIRGRLRNVGARTPERTRDVGHIGGAHGLAICQELTRTTEISTSGQTTCRVHLPGRKTRARDPDYRPRHPS
jgi:hypothetical protein